MIIMKAYIYNLIFEVTRKCNLHCEHCLQGNAQNLDLSKEIVGAEVGLSLFLKNPSDTFLL